MHVRDAENHEEVWLLDNLEEEQITEISFRSRDYRIAVDPDTGDRMAFGRRNTHNDEDGDVFEIRNTGTAKGVEDSAETEIIVSLLKEAIEEGFENVFAVPEEHEAFVSIGFNQIDFSELPNSIQKQVRANDREDSVTPVRVNTSEWAENNEDLFGDGDDEEEHIEIEELKEEFQTDDEMTYKYST